MRILDKKLKKVLEMRTDTPEMLESLDSLSYFYTKEGNTLETRRSLRTDIEDRGLQLVKNFLENVKEIENVFFYYIKIYKNRN